MTYDAHKNFGFTVVALAPSTPTAGTTFSVLNANAANLPDPASVGAYNLTITAANQQPLSTNSEIIRVTAKGAADSGGAGFTQFTISRLAENNAGGSMTARSIQVGDWISHSLTAKTITDVETNKLDRDGSQAMTGTLVMTPTNRALNITGVSTASVDVVNITDSGVGAGIKSISTSNAGANAGVFRNQGFAVDTTVHIQRSLMDASQPAAIQAVLKVQKDNSNVNDIGNLIGINNFNTNASTNCLYIEQHGTGPILRTNDGTNVIFDIDYQGNWKAARSGTGIGVGRSLTIQAAGAESGQSNLAGGTLILGSGISTGSGLSAINFVIYKTVANGTNDNATTTFVMNQASSGTINFGLNPPTSSIAGNPLKIFGQPAAAATDLNGGNLDFASGTSRGTGSSDILFETAPTGTTGSTINNTIERMRIKGNGNIGIGMSSPTALLHLAAGTATTNTSPLKFTSGANLATPETGTMEFDGTSFYLTPSSTRKTIGYTDMSNLVPVASFSMNSQKIINLLDPTGAQDAATKNYVDALAQGLSLKPSAIVATTTTLPTYTYLSSVITMTATGIVAIDGHNLALNDVILVKNETSTNQPNNGLYTVTTAGAVGVALILTRHTFMDTSTEFSGGFVFVESGTVNAAAGFVCTNTGSVTVGTTNISFTQFSGAGEITTGNSLTKTGNTLDTIQDIRTSASPVFAGLSVSGLTVTGQTIISSNAGAALAVGPNGSTNPVLKIDGSVTGSVTGINISGNAATGGAFINVTSSGTNEKLYIDAKGSGSINVGQNSTGDINLGITATSRNVFTYGNSYIEGNSSDTLRVRYAGTGNNAFQVDAGTVSAVTGVLIKGNIAASGVAMSVLSSGTDENITFDAKGAGTITFGGISTGNIIISRTLNLGTNSLNTVGNIEIDGTAARDITVGANAAAAAGNAQTISAGNSGAGTDLAGGNLILRTGLGTGVGSSQFQLWLNQPASSTGSGVGTLVNVLIATLTSAGSIGFSSARAAAANGGGLTKWSGQDGGTNSNRAGGEFRVQSGQSTGTGSPGQFTIYGSPLSPSSSGTQNTAIQRYSLGATKVLTNNSAINLVNFTLASNTVISAVVRYAIEVFDGTNLQLETGEIMVQCANKGGVFSGNTVTQIANDGTTLGKPKQILISGTLGTAAACVWAITGANPAVLSVNANSSLTPSSGYPRITYTIENYTQQAIAIQ